MYTYVTDREFLSRMKKYCGAVMQDLCHELRVKYQISAIFYLVGSSKRNMVLQNENRPIDLDYNLEIQKVADINDCRTIKESVRKAFDTVLAKKYSFWHCEDSTSSLTTKRISFSDGNRTEFSMDVCIVYRDKESGYNRLIHEKTGFSYDDKYYWNQVFDSTGLRKKISYIKKKSSWLKVREEYLKLKNNYLVKNDNTHPSFVCYIEAVNNVYNALRQQVK